MNQKISGNILLIFRKQVKQVFSIEKVFRSLMPFFKGINISEKNAITKSADLKGLLKNGRYFRRQKADLYHITGDIHYVAMFLPGNKTVLTIHDCVFLYHPNKLKRFLLNLLWLQLPAKRIKIITTISTKSKEEILRFCKCDPEKIVVISNPVNTAFVPGFKQFNSQRPRILHVGVKPNKNLDRVIEALSGIDCSLHIIGKLNEHQLSLLEKHRIGFTNRFDISEEELVQTYQQSDLLLFPSLYEGFGLPIIEAQSVGIPVITSSIEPMRSNAGEGALLVEPENVEAIREGIMKVISDASLRDQLVNEGFKNIRRFQPEIIAESYKEVYRRVLAS